MNALPMSLPILNALSLADHTSVHQRSVVIPSSVRFLEREGEERDGNAQSNAAHPKTNIPHLYLVEMRAPMSQQTTANAAMNMVRKQRAREKPVRRRSMRSMRGQVRVQSMY